MSRTAIHPGERLAEELTEIGLSAAELARQIEVPVNRITGIINGQRGITADTALRLGHWFGTSPQFWMNLQQLYELRRAEHAVGKKLARLPQRDGLPGSLAPTKTVSRRGRARVSGNADWRGADRRWPRCGGRERCEARRYGCRDLTHARIFLTGD